MTDYIFSSFLEEQEADALAMARESDLLEVEPVGTRPYQHYLLRFRCKGLVHEGGRIVEAERFEVGVYFPADYHDRVNPAEVLTLLGPVNVFHPNVRFPFICPGNIWRGMPIYDLALQVHEILTWNKYNMNEFDALSPAVCKWARQHVDRFPIDDRPLLNRRAKPKLRWTESPKEAGR
jgi:hypothetical protein